MGTVRLNEKLDELLMRTVEHTGLDITTILKACRNGLIRKRACKTFADIKMFYEAGEIIRGGRGFELPPLMAADDFRKALALRCLEALEKPPRPVFSFPEKENRDYLVEE